MADIVAIHGIFMHRSSRREMHDSWLAKISEGLRDTRSPHAESVTLECAFYGHEYNDGKAGPERNYRPEEIAPGFETELIISIGAEIKDDYGDREGDKLYLPGPLQKALAKIQRSRLFEGRDSVLISFVKQVDRYLNDPAFRALVQDEVGAAMTEHPRLVIGHSLGSVVAYDWLQRNVLPNRPVLLTLGSPLGLESVRRRLHQPADRSRWPDGARSWTNIAAGHDAVAMVKELAPLYHPDVDDVPCTNPRATAHHATSYLSNVRVSRSIDAALT
ncbi:hypothetical protein [Kutzneria sp. 744]|uniref:hypothetical protein n=1 Tax=Kutzneria sp. (strain 744) TaxID=345341 RepID=UPI0003EED5A9|nr:hypothetical protein [Kutzneria sp. 744]EWM12647.1 hypothetical protein KUTG_02951 [Kutzneria sp. 744]